MKVRRKVLRKFLGEHLKFEEDSTERSFVYCADCPAEGVCSNAPNCLDEIILALEADYQKHRNTIKEQQEHGNRTGTSTNNAD